MPGSADDKKAAAREAELEAETQDLITALGEAGWRSPFFTGKPGELDHGEADARYRMHRTWTMERDHWTRTGDPAHLELMRAAVDWKVPPERGEVCPRPQPGWPARHRKLAWVIVFLGAVCVLLVVITVIMAAFSI